MTTAPPIERPAAGRPAPAPPPPRQAVAARADARLAAVVALLVAACLPLARVYVGLGFLRPVLAAALLSIAVGWGARRLGAGPVSGLLASALSWALFVALAFTPATLAAGVLPTWETFGAVRETWLRGIELIRTRPAPAFPEAGMLLITASGVWWVAHAVEGLVFRLQAPLRAIAMALLLWTVPLAMAPAAGRPWLWAVPLLAAAAGLLLTTARADLDHWTASEAPRRGLATFDSTGWAVAAVAIVAGAALAGLLPGYGERPFYELRGLGGTTITTNPIVSLRTNLVTQDGGPVVEVTTPQPVYLRLTALDVYSEREEWTSPGIRGGPASGRLPPETDWAAGRELTVGVEVRALPGAVIVPVPYQPVRLSGPASDRFAYDRARATVTLAANTALEPGDVYEVQALLPEPSPEVLEIAPVDGADPALTALPDSVPDDVEALARSIVEEAGATTPFDQALALQRELRTWTYSLEPPQGHSASAMQSFIDNRVGYCEQFAGTMAVMLRTLGIPARVAVGYTPGDLVEETEDGLQRYVVRNSNAHAWVEVLFPGLGWMPFEPTPRSDGNLLTPTAANLVPTVTDAQGLTSAGITDVPLDDEFFLERPGDLADLPEADLPAGAGAASGDGGGVPLGLGLLLGAMLLLGAGAAAWRVRRGDAAALVPSEAVLRAVDRIRRAGRGLGVPPRTSETDREYLLRLAGPVAATHDLADAAEQARYARFVPAEVAQRTSRDARALLGRLREERSAPAWALAWVRGWVATGLWRVGGSRRRAASEASGWQPSAERLHRLVRRRAGRRDVTRVR